MERGSAVEASYCSAAELAAGYAARALDPVVVTQAAVEAAQAARLAYNAVSVVDERCLEAAKQSRDRYGRGGQLGPLDGVPVTVKDSYQCEGLPRWHGSAVHDGSPLSSVDSAPVRRLREAGAIVIGKTTMPDFGMLASGVSSQFGVITNPWNTRMTPGGSSSGAGATLVAGVTPVAMGTDIAGSVRLPAAHCGVAAIKPTQGRIAYLPASMVRSAGLMARSASDLETMLAVVGRSDGGDPWCLPGAFAPAAWGIERVRGMRVALLTHMGYGLPVHPETQEVVRGAADVLAAWGARITELRLDLTDSDFDALDLSFKLRALAEVDSVSRERRALLLNEIRMWSDTARQVSATEATLAALVVDQARDRVIAATADYDLIVAPVLPVHTFPADHAGPSAGHPPLYHASFCAWFNQTGQPAASICGGRDAVDALPIGIQIVGQRFRDADVLRAAVLLEEALAVTLPWPGVAKATAPVGALVANLEVRGV
jgi:aspartyl-tRNA(Asn)/glutamyl-tRNA(Gln) amidotransferase subunit A